MPGLSQLKQFNKDIQSLGDEITLRAMRGEKPVVVPIPKDIKDVSDAEDFVLGMPDNPKFVDNSTVDEDLSDITGLVSGKTSENSEEAPAFAAPDLSSLLAPVEMDSSSSDDMGMPDLSMFMDEPEEIVEEVVEEEPEEISVADMGLEALLAGAGFDGTEGAQEETVEEISDFEEMEDVSEPVQEIPAENEDELKVDYGDELNKILYPDRFPEKAPAPTADDLFSDISADVLEDISTLDEANNEQPADTTGLDDLETLDDLSFDTPATDDFGLPEGETPSLDLPVDFGSDDEQISSPTGEFDAPALSEDFEQSDDFGNFSEADSFDSFEAPAETFDMPEGDFDSFETPSDLPSETPDASADNSETDNFDINSFELPDDFGTETDFSAGSDLGTDADFGSDTDFGSTDDFGTADFGTDTDFGAEETTEALADGVDIFGSNSTDAADDFGSTDSFDLPEEPSVSDLFNSEDVDLPDMNTAMEDIPDYGEEESSGADVFGSDSTETSDDFGSESFETFDTTGMDDMDFGIQDTDAQLNGDGGDFEFDAGNIDMEGTDFEIPGFSDVTTAAVEPKSTSKKGSSDLDEPDFSGAVPGDELPPNTLSDEQYKQFLKNLNEYPLNVRLAFEDLIVQDEFTDDAEFEIIEKILNKVPARQVASTLEKMLDTSIPVPRDFEHRTAEEYEAYKKSLSYQLKNKILPGFLCGILLLLVSWGLYNFTNNCIVIPAKASKLYKQGYALLQSDEYAQSQIKFDQAATYQLKKKWFFNYARGYRDHKQYQRAEDIYGKLLIYFNHDKTAGLEYAQMELNDLSNYEKAEEVVRREILDYHINDADGILMLGDVFLEWGTEKDSEKLELAKEQYLKLIQLYKPNDLYNSRMMRYFIRTDNLAQVLNYRNMFASSKKTKLPAEDWTELGGYLLEKLYGYIAPSDESLRYEIEGLRELLMKAVNLDESNPIALYNLGNYFVQTSENTYVEPTLKLALEKFNAASQLRKRDIYKYIDTYRLLGENYLLTKDYLQAQEQFTDGITLYTTEKENAGFEGNEKIGLLYSDLADINYSIAGDYENASKNYKNAVSLGYDNSNIRYRLGYISYKNKNYLEALGSFMKAGEGSVKEKNLLLAMANTLSLRNDDYAAEGYYEQLITKMDNEITERGGTVFPQADLASNDLVTTYLYAANNYGVTLHRLAKRTGNSQKNAQAIVQFQQSLRAWDSLTRDQKTLLRLDGSNLAQENIKYITHPVSEFEPAIYLEIPKNLNDYEGL